MENLVAYISQYWWVIVAPMLLIVGVTLSRGRALNWVLFWCLIVGVLYYSSEGTTWRVGSALVQFIDLVAEVLDRIVARLV
jgi:hypothetical protein